MRQTGNPDLWFSLNSLVYSLTTDPLNISVRSKLVKLEFYISLYFLFLHLTFYLWEPGPFVSFLKEELHK